MPVMILGLVWWYIGGLREVGRQIPHLEVANGFLMFCLRQFNSYGHGYQKT